MEEFRQCLSKRKPLHAPWRHPWIHQPTEFFGSFFRREFELNITQEVLRIVDEVLSLNGRAATFTRDTPLLGAIPE